MPGSDNQSTSNSLPINEGVVKKGGVNSPPLSTRPAPPTGQAGSGSSSQGESGLSSQSNSDGSS